VVPLEEVLVGAVLEHPQQTAALSSHAAPTDFVNNDIVVSSPPGVASNEVYGSSRRAHQGPTARWWRVSHIVARKQKKC
jgi:hypothetical protein